MPEARALSRAFLCVKACRALTADLQRGHLQKNQPKDPEKIIRRLVYSMLVLCYRHG